MNSPHAHHLSTLFIAAQGLWAAFCLIWLVWGWISTRQRPIAAPRQREGPRGLLIIAVLVVCLALSSHRRFPTAGLWPGHPLLAATGLCIEILGLALAVFARYHLGTFWSSAAVLRQGHRLIDTGPYRLVRHPIYSGIGLAVFGTFLMNGGLLALVFLVIIGVLFCLRIYKEESLLRQELGQEYTAYCEHTRRLIPWLL